MKRDAEYVEQDVRRRAPGPRFLLPAGQLLNYAKEDKDMGGPRRRSSNRRTEGNSR
jgi:hypothetical protein